MMQLVFTGGARGTFVGMVKQQGLIKSATGADSLGLRNVSVDVNNAGSTFLHNLHFDASLHV